ALELARQKAKLPRDVIVALTAGEETGGGAGVRWILANRRELFDAEIALNEGGSALLSPDLSNVRTVGLGVAEKTFQSYRLWARGKGGPGSVPAAVTPFTPRARPLVKIGDHRFEQRVLPYVTDTLARAAATEKAPLAGALKHASETAPRVEPQDGEILAKD